MRRQDHVYSGFQLQGLQARKRVIDCVLMDVRGEITGLLQAWKNGDAEAVDSLLPIIYNELRRMAAAYMRWERPDHTLTPTALVHESYLKIFPGKRSDFHDRKHFFTVAAHAMRQLLVDHARRRRAGKRGGPESDLPLEDSLQVAGDSWDVIGLDDALRDLEKLDPRKAEVVHLRFFAGLTLEEIGELTDTSPATAMREVRLAQAWLAHEIRKT
jgi:RNA polymerase sigma factor (TIGR02999 family)